MVHNPPECKIISKYTHILIKYTMLFIDTRTNIDIVQPYFHIHYQLITNRNFYFRNMQFEIKLGTIHYLSRDIYGGGGGHLFY